MEVKVTVKYSYYRKYLADHDFSGVILNAGSTVQRLVEELEVPAYYIREVTVNGGEERT